MHKTKMTYAEAKQIVKSLEMRISKTEYDEYRVTTADNSEACACYTNHLDDAVATARAMAAHEAARAPHHYEPPMAYHYHNTPCKLCGKTSRHNIHQVLVKAPVNPCAFCGEAFSDHRAASDNSAPFCNTRDSRPGDRFVRDVRASAFPK